MKMQFELRGMHCSSCAAAIERSVKKLDGAKDVYVNFAAALLTLEADTALLSESKIMQTVKQTGFEAVPVQENPRDPAETEAQEASESLLRLLLAFFFSLLLIYTAMHKMFGLPFFDLSQGWKTFLQVIFLIPVVFAGRDFYRSGFRSLLKFSPNMDSLVALCTSAAVVYSFYLMIAGKIHHLYFDSAAMILTLIMLGKYLEARSRFRASAAVRELMKLTPEIAHRIDLDDVETDIPVRDLKIGDIVRVRAGERIPADGVVTEGESSVDESMLTGESMPVAKYPESKVTGGSVNGNGGFLYRVEQVGHDTVISRIIAMVRDAQGSRPPIAKIADIVSGFFVWGVILISLLTFCIWFFAVKVSFADSLGFALAVLVVACPCALGLATPIALIAGIGRGAGLGILIKDGTSLETAGKVTVAVFDKTGTVTEGKPQVCAVRPAEGTRTDILLQYATSAEKQSNHPLAAAILSAAGKQELSLLQPSEIREFPGKGMFCKFGTNSFLLGNALLLNEQKIIVPDIEEKGSVIYAALNGVYIGAVIVRDPVKRTSVSAVAALHKQGIRCIMLTGDNQLSAQETAEILHIRDFRAGLLPDDKAGIIAELQKQNEIVAMVGDGINDAPSLAKADVGISLSGGSDIAMESAGIVLMQHDLSRVPVAIELSRATMRVIRQNLFWAFCYNIICIPLAAGAFYTWLGWKLSPEACALTMAFSSVSVVLNALRLRKFQ